jgi:hypothetical protein
MTDEWTCGKGLAAHADLPRAIGDMIEALAAMLDAHTRALDLTDEHGRNEYAAYASLVAQHRTIASSLRAMSEEMAGCHDLPMARHDMAVLESEEVTGTFASLVQVERALLRRLSATLEEHEQLLTGAQPDSGQP